MMKTPEWWKRLVVPITSKIVYSSDAYVSLKSTLNDLSARLVDFSHPPSGPADQRLLDFARLVRPWTSRDLELIRVGGAHDGGYVMVNDFNVTGAISIGVGRDVSWDREVASRSIPVVMLDPTIRRPPERVERGRFFRVGLGPRGSVGRYRPLPALLDLAGMPGEKNLLLKIDVEGAEWEALRFLEPEVLSRFSQIVIELHNLDGLNESDGAEAISEVATVLFRGHLPVHIHANNYDRLVRFDAYWFPQSIELSYVRRDLIEQAVPATALDHKLDFPCDVRVTDISLQGILTVSPG